MSCEKDIEELIEERTAAEQELANYQAEIIGDDDRLGSGPIGDPELARLTKVAEDAETAVEACRARLREH
jgi:hypothetical protein